jgi:DNA-binding PadR family transcriptional regulator
MHDYRLGAFEELVLLAIWGLGADDAYAVSVQQRIEQRADRPATMGAVYTALDRLEQKGLVSSWLGPVTPERGGKRKRLYRLTGTGEAAVYDVRRARERMWEGIDFKPGLDLG